MKRRSKIIFLALSMLALCTLILSLSLLVPSLSHVANAQSTLHAFPAFGEKASKLAAMRAAGLKKDPTKIPMLIHSLNYPSHPHEYYASMHALAQLGAIAATPSIDKIATETNDEDLRDYALVSKARLCAEDGCRKIKDPAQSNRKKLQLFLDAVNLNVDQLNATVASEKASGHKGYHDPTGRGIYILREIADMAYQQHDASLIDYANRLNVNFAPDWGANLKAHLASLSSSQRIDWLIKELAEKEVLRSDDYFTISLCSDEGLHASQAAADQLRHMKSHRDRYHYIGFAALLFVINGVGDKRQTPLVEQFCHDQDGWVSHYAEIAYINVKDGVPFQYRAGF